MKIKSLPHLSNFKKEESGIKRVVEAYHKYLPQFDIETVEPDATSYDLLVAHAGMGNGTADVAHLHGLYWTADYESTNWEFEANARIVNELQVARQVTVPSQWVAKTLQRDMRINPHVIGHGIDWDKWQHNYRSEGYVLWNKNRVGDVCSPKDVNKLAAIFNKVEFISTFGNGADLSKRNQQELQEIRSKGLTPHYINIGVRNHLEMQELIQKAGVYLSTTKETFGIGVLEAMAAGVPVLGYNQGGNVDLIEHGVNGYLATDFDDLVEGLIYCLEHQKTLGDNGRQIAKEWTWLKQIEKVADVYRLANKPQPATVAVVIPVYNKTPGQVERAVESCLKQTLQPQQVIVVNDGSEQDYHFVESMGSENYYPVEYIKQDNQGVAIARNSGISQANTKYICCLDADDWIEPTFLEVCINALEDDKTLDIAYTKLKWHNHNEAKTGISEWPGEWDFDRQVNYKKRQNQVPTCCVFRRDMWQRLGGFRQRYAPQGAGAEDAEFWTRSGAYGFGAKLVTQEALFNYSLGGNTSEDYQEPDWLAWHPWAKDNQHPFASYATPEFKSHPVRQYDEPLVSVIIPVGPGHEQNVIDALDSLEAQTFRKWEAIVIDDTQLFDNEESNKIWNMIFDSYPYIVLIDTGSSEPKGAGIARNRGVEEAKAPFILFLDADDTLHPDAIETMVTAWNQQQKAIYTDYVGQAFIEEQLAAQLQQQKRLLSYNPEDGEAFISYKAFDFDCERALRQPESPPYIWCNITTLIPKQWHYDIGGFDESMETWEDWDYWLRMAWAGKCFYRVQKELLRYRFYTGQRRDKAAGDTELGRQVAQKMIKYIAEKDINKMACGCGKSSNGKQAVTEQAATASNDNDYVRAKYTGKRGNHHIVGAYKMPNEPQLPSRRIGQEFAHYYGYGQEGAISLVHREDIKLMVGKWLPVEEVIVPEAEKPIIEPPKSITFELQTVPGVTDTIAKALEQAGLTTRKAILEAGIAGLENVKGIGDKRASIIVNYLQTD